MLVLSLFPGIGLLDMAFEEHGCCVVRGPDLLWGGDIHHFHPPADTFDGIIGGPPCQCFSRLAHMVRHNGLEVAPNLIPEFSRVVQAAQPEWFVMENVPAAPWPHAPGYALHAFDLNNRWLGEEQNRLRQFVFGIRGGPPIDLRRWIEYSLSQHIHYAPAVMASGGGNNGGVSIRQNQGGKPKRLPPNNRSTRTFEENCRLQGLPEGFLRHAPFTVQGKLKVVGNGVPLPMGRAIAGAVTEALEWKRSK